MKRKTFFMLVALLMLCVHPKTTMAAEASTAIIPSDAVKYNNHFYKVYDNALSWTKASQSCKDVKGHLVTIKDRYEQNFVENLLKNKGKKDNYWIGACFNKTTEKWCWETGEAFTYTNWDNKQPDNNDGSEFYVRMMQREINYPEWTAHAGTWNDASNEADGAIGDCPLRSFGYVCEWESNSITPISNITLQGMSKKIAAGKKIQLKAIIKPANASYKKLTWKSSNTKVATVTSTGLVTLKPKSYKKSVTITATANDGSNVKATYKILSMKGIVTKISISGKSVVKAGKTIKLKAKVSAKAGANKALKWTSSNNLYAKVSKSGVVTAYKKGIGKTVVITASATDGSGKKATKRIRIK